MTNHAALLDGLDRIPMSDHKRARAEVAVRHSTAIVDFVLSIAYYARFHGRETTRS